LIDVTENDWIPKSHPCRSNIGPDFYDNYTNVLEIYPHDNRSKVPPSSVFRVASTEKFGKFMEASTTTAIQYKSDITEYIYKNVNGPNRDHVAYVPWSLPITIAVRGEDGLGKPTDNSMEISLLLASDVMQVWKVHPTCKQ
jgi:hypothetical protein